MVILALCNAFLFYGYQVKHLDLFSGIGGFALAAQWAGIETMAFCEIEPYAQKVLAKNFPGIPIFEDIRKLHATDLPERPDVITGGYPCQPFSIAGKRRGQEDDRHLWPEMFRVIRECRPAWVVCENVLGHVTMGLDEVLADLENEDYACWPFIVPACSVGAPHKRYRVWIVANSNTYRLQGVNTPSSSASINEREWLNIARVASEILSGKRNSVPESWVVGKNSGISRRVDRTKGLGNAIVPQVAYEILRWLSETR